MSGAYSLRGPLVLGAVAVALLVGGFGLWAVAARLEGAVVVPGRVEPAGIRQAVQHPEGGVVAMVAVREGDTVAAGQVLLRLDGTLLAAELASVAGQLAELGARRARLEAERDGAALPAFPAAPDPALASMIEGQRRLFLARAETAAREDELLARRIEQTRRRIDAIAAEAEAAATQLALIGQEAAAVDRLYARGLAEAARHLALRREEARLRGQVGAHAAERAEAEAALAEAAAEGLRRAAARREQAAAELREIAPREADLDARRHALEARIARLDIRAPVAGIVLGLAVAGPRAVLRPAEPAMVIVPREAPLVVAARIPAGRVAALHPGQGVRMILPAPGGGPGSEVRGTLVRISADALADERSGLPYFAAEIRPAAGGPALRPGTPVEAFVETGARSPLAWLAAPLTAYFARALREG